MQHIFAISHTFELTKVNWSLAARCADCRRRRGPRLQASMRLAIVKQGRDGEGGVDTSNGLFHARHGGRGSRGGGGRDFELNFGGFLTAPAQSLWPYPGASWRFTAPLYRRARRPGRPRRPACVTSLQAAIPLPTFETPRERTPLGAGRGQDNAAGKQGDKFGSPENRHAVQ